MPARSLPRRALLVLLVVLAGCAGFLAYRARLAEAPPAAIIGVVRETEIHIAPETSGRLASILVAPGQRVRKGDLLAVLSNPELAASLDEAKASVGNARADRANVYAGVRKEEVDAAAQGVQIAEFECCARAGPVCASSGAG